MAERDGAYASLAEAAAELDGYYVPTRYPNGLPDGIPARVFGRKAAERALGVARELVGRVEDGWPPNPSQESL